MKFMYLESEEVQILTWALRERLERAGTNSSEQEWELLEKLEAALDELE